MLPREENVLVTQISPGTPMGETMRRYWIPALLSEELPEPDCAPVRVQLLGEQLVGFRDTQGRIGLLDEFCPHRRVSMFFGRNEECGLRCVYHGWKFDVTGACVDQMNEPPEHSFAHKIRIPAYPTVEVGGVIWAYMGPAAKMPPPPHFEWTQMPASHRHVSKVIQECNWLQALEGGIDTSHAPILHRTLSSSATRPGVPFDGPFVQGGAPTLDVDVTDYGYRYAGVRPLKSGETYVRTYHYVMPFTQIRPQQFRVQGTTMRTKIAGHFWVPMDDTTTMVWNWMYSYGDEPLTEEDRLERGSGNGPDHVDQQTFRSYRNRSNNWMLDRQVQKTETFTGIDGINTQDRALQETMGAVVDRSLEHLGPADRAIIVARRLLMQALTTVEEGGDPLGTDTSYYQARAIEQVLPKGVAWRDALLPEMYPGSMPLAAAD
ncbi:MAG: Rieske 2Fe-2S domain-containing protein [Candidatus Tectomicrobia bacterium]|uniref:Rieske 2Fe-2S domain-containing protein n=1 Tax=Tectimicrobiota bacterium TaxID=2528274 RepID=A0A937VYV7_UNCTE|nr:Rieske 2Fe-2S domain-containing protein [Candidatus Tectomicrobia bacterium]